MNVISAILEAVLNAGTPIIIIGGATLIISIPLYMFTRLAGNMDQRPTPKVAGGSGHGGTDGDPDQHGHEDPLWHIMTIVDRRTELISDRLEYVLKQTRPQKKSLAIYLSSNVFWATFGVVAGRIIETLWMVPSSSY